MHKTPYEILLLEMAGTDIVTATIELDMKMHCPSTVTLDLCFMIKAEPTQEVANIENIYSAETYRELALGALDGTPLPYYPDGEESGL